MAIKPPSKSKEKHWREIKKEVEKIIDGAGKPVDAGIKKTVVALRALEINTSTSCEGHHNWGIASPWVDISSAGADNLEKAGKIRSEKKRLKFYRNKLEPSNLREVKKLMPYLNKFYQNRRIPYDQRLIIDYWGWGIGRITCQGGKQQKIESSKERIKNLGRYRKEMRAFTEFLKREYFNHK